MRSHVFNSSGLALTERFRDLGGLLKVVDFNKTLLSALGLFLIPFRFMLVNENNSELNMTLVVLKNYCFLRFRTQMRFHAKGHIKKCIMQLSHCFSKYRRLREENDASDVI